MVHTSIYCVYTFYILLYHSTVQLQPVNRGAVTGRRHCPGQSEPEQLQNLKCPAWMPPGARTRNSESGPGDSKWPERRVGRCGARAGYPTPAAARWRGRAGQRLLCIVLVKERNSTNVFTPAAQWLSWWLVCTRYRVQVLLLCIFFQKSFVLVYTCVCEYICFRNVMSKYILVYPCLLLYVHVYAWISVLHCNIYFNFQSMYKYILICQNIRHIHGIYFENFSIL
jgi:hypothetical protein